MNFPEDIRNQLKVQISERCGLYFRDHDLKNLESGVIQRMKVLGFDSVHAYYLHLTTSQEKEIEFRELLNLLTINHTYFFRNEPQFAALKDKVLPDLIAQKKRQVLDSTSGEKPKLRIWSAGCSTGEEPYTIAMILRELIPSLGDWDIEILATDASSEAVAKAQSGIYSENSMRLVEEPYRSKYFSKVATSRASGEWKLSDEIKRMVKFSFLNLVEDPYPSDLDIVFCRNVTIYFEVKTTIKIMEDFALNMTDPGYLFLGSSESLQYLTPKFRIASWLEGIYYRKATGKSEEGESTPLWTAGETAEEKYDEETLPLTLAVPTEHSKHTKLSTEEFEALRQMIVRYIYLKDYAKATDLIENVAALIETVSLEGERMADIHYLEADIFANKNQPEEAKARLKKALELNSLFAPAYFLLGCIDFEAGRIAQAKDHLNRALYIDRDFVMARFYMAHAFRSEGRVSEAVREYRNTLTALSKGTPSPRSRMILQSSGFNFATLKGVCRDNLERLKMES
ncbi:MAG: CheR family methyltransferase [Candidatus Omnitrophota bacterium]